MVGLTNSLDHPSSFKHAQALQTILFSLATLRHSGRCYKWQDPINNWMLSL